MSLKICVDQVIAAPLPPPDYNICPDCRMRAKALSREARIRQPYCSECAKRHARERYILKGRQK